MTDLSKIIGNKIRNIRKKRGLSQEELSHLANMNTSFLSDLERDKKNPSLESLEKVTTALDITLEQLFQHTQPNLNNPESKILDEVINRVQVLSIDNQKRILEMITIMTEWKSK